MATELMGLETERRKVLSVCSAPIAIAGSVRGSSSRDSRFQLLHYVYALASDHALAVSGKNALAKASQPAEVEFDIEGVHVFNFPGDIYVTGGNAADTLIVNLHVHRLERARPHWHPLTAILAAADRYTVPTLHTRMRIRGAAASAVSVQQGPTFLAGPDPVFLTPGFSELIPTDDLQLQTEYFG